MNMRKKQGLIGVCLIIMILCGCTESKPQTQNQPQTNTSSEIEPETESQDDSNEGNASAINQETSALSDEAYDTMESTESVWSSYTTLGALADSPFSIQFIDVGQGDSALVQCDGYYMLIDGGDTSARDKVYDVLEYNGVQHLSILAISHLHADHIGGLEKALTYASDIEMTIGNAYYPQNETVAFNKFEQRLIQNGSSITIPDTGDVYTLGSAKVEVVDVASETQNDSLVLMVTYGKTKFLFTGDIEYEGQKRLADKYQKANGKPYKIDLIKMPHHGSYGDDDYVHGSADLNRLITVFKPSFAIISCGKGNSYGHPSIKTLDLLEQADAKIYRTDLNGDIIVRSDGKDLSFETSK